MELRVVLTRKGVRGNESDVLAHNRFLLRSASIHNVTLQERRISCRFAWNDLKSVLENLTLNTIDIGYRGNWTKGRPYGRWIIGSAKATATTLEEAKKQRCQKLFSKPEAQRIEEKVFRRNRKEGILGRGRTFNTLLSSKC